MPQSKPLALILQEEIAGILEKYSGQGLTLGEILGCFETIKMNLWYAEMGKRNEDEPDNELLGGPTEDLF